MPEFKFESLNQLDASLRATGVLSPQYAATILGFALNAVAEAHAAGREAGRRESDPPPPSVVPDDERLFLADRLRDAWAVLRCVTARDGAEALRKHGIDYDEVRGTGTRDALAEDVARAEAVLRSENEFALALLNLWQAEGGECAHGVGFEADCPGDGPKVECHWQQFRPALRAAHAALVT